MGQKTVIIGENPVPVPPMNAFKVLRAGDIVARVGKAYPDVMRDVAKFTRAYQEERSVRITPDMAKMPRFRRWNLTDEDFGSKGYIEVPQAPSDYEVFGAVFPTIFEKAKAEVRELLALVLTPNSKLEEQDMADSVDDFLQAEGKRLLHTISAEQLPDVALTVGEVVKEQFAGKSDVVGNVVALVEGLFRRPARRDQEQTSSTQKPSSSTDSPSPTDGAETKSSTAPVGVT